MASAAQAKALGTTELLEAILFHTDPKTVLLARRVCVKWDQVIVHSHLIQQHLFFRPIAGTTPVRLNPLLVEAFPPFFEVPQPVADQCAPESSPFTRFSPVRLARRMMETFRLRQASSDLPEEEEETPEDDPELHPHFIPDDLQNLPLAQDARNAAFLYEKASWRNMFPCQPPPESFLCLEFVRSRGGTRQSFSRISEKRVARLNDSGELAEGEEDLGEASPVRMETLFHLVTGGWGDKNGWLWIWETRGAETVIPRDIGFNEIGEARRKVMKRRVTEDGLCVVQSSVVQCTDGEPWRFEDKFLVRPRYSGRLW